MAELIRQIDDWSRAPATARRSMRLLGGVLLASIIAIIAIAPVRTSAQDVEVLLPEKECQVKYALLYSFGLMTTWPPQAFNPPDTGPFVIGVLGSKPFPEYLDRIAQTKKVQNRPIVIRRWKNAEEIDRCHVLYVTNAVTLDVEQAVVRKLANQPVLIVSERPAETPSSAIIQFLIEQGTVRFALNADIAKAHHLQIDARLQRLAKRTVSDSPKH